MTGFEVMLRLNLNASMGSDTRGCTNVPSRCTEVPKKGGGKVYVQGSFHWLCFDQSYQSILETLFLKGKEIFCNSDWPKQNNSKKRQSENRSPWFKLFMGDVQNILRIFFWTFYGLYKICPRFTAPVRNRATNINWKP